MDQTASANLQPTPEALLIPELVFLVVKYLRPRDQRCFGSTCHFLWQIAAEELWAGDSIPGRALAELVPDDLELVRVSVYKTRLDWSRPLQNVDYHRLEYYGRYVRSLSITDDSPRDGRRVQALLPLLSTYPNLRKLFPRLLDLHVQLCLGDGSIAPFVPPLLRLPLTDISIDFSNTGNHAGHGIILNDVHPTANANVTSSAGAAAAGGVAHQAQEIARFSPASLHKICDAVGVSGEPVLSLWLQVLLAGAEWEDALTQSVLLMIPRIWSVQTLTLYVRADLAVILPGLATLPKLEVLHIDTVSQLEEWPPLEVPQGSFPSLRLLHLDSYLATFDPPPVEDILRVVSSPVFSELICFSTLQRMRSWLRVVAHEWPSTIEALQVQLTPTDHEACTVVELVEPLFACRELRQLHISCPSGLRVYPEHVDTMTAAWPQMESFSIATAHLPVVSGRDLQLIVSKWPRLEALHLAFNFDLPLVKMEATGSPASILHTFNAGYSTISDEAAVADLLRTTVPHLQHFYVLGGHDENIRILLGLKEE